MQWDLGLPLLVMFATGVVMLLIFFGARALLFKPRKDEGTDDGSESHAH